MKSGALAAQTNLSPVQTLQNKILRIITEAPYFVKNTTLHKDLQMEYIKDVIINQAKKLYERCATSVNPEVVRLGNQDPLRVRKSPNIIVSVEYEQFWNY